MGMKSMYELRDMLCKELDELARKGELGAGDLEIAHKLTATIKNIDKIEMMEDGGYSRDEDYSRRYSRDGDWQSGMRVICPMRDAARIMCAATIPVMVASTT